MIYLDNAATTFPKPESVYVAMDKANRELGVNAGRGSYTLARKATSLIDETKQLLRKLVSADVSANVVFTPSITIAMNQIVFGLRFKDGDNIYVSPYEHNAVARTINYLSKKVKVNVIQLPLCEETLEIDIDKTKYMFSTNNPAAVFCTHISNVTGYILPVEEIFAESRRYMAVNVLDSAQSLGLIPVNIKKVNADIIAFAGHKSLYGPFGVGGFININRVDLDVVIAGGTGSDSLNLDMPSESISKYEPSSMNIVAIAGLNAALKDLNQEGNYQHEKELTEILVEKFRKNRNIKLYVPNNPDKHIGIISFSYNGMISEDVGAILDQDFDIAVRTGYHCAPYIHEKLNDNKTLGTIRIGLGQYNSLAEIESLISALIEIDE